ncbi:MAG: lytic transglycosylase domain-containing protein [Bacteroidota bacterium]|nr:lytic transglycosylase domain-containing protein [Bacteroidota bacterium]
MRNKSGIILFLCICLCQSVFSVEPLYSFPIPSGIEFAGQTISLERYDMRERFDREQIVIAYNHSVSFLIIKRANRYFPVIEPILKQNGVPDDFKYLAVIESNLDPRAFSGAQAAGLWQLMPKTAQQLGLEVNDEIDERYHVEKSTQAACKYFKSAYAKFKNWTTVAASYNAGMGRISEEKENQQVEEAFDMLLTSESSRYVFRILAMKQFLENPKAFGYVLSHDQFYQTVNTKEVTVKGPVGDWTVWAAQNGISYSQLKDFNPWLRDRKLTNPTGRDYLLQLPDKNDFKFNLAKIKIHNPVWVTF